MCDHEYKYGQRVQKQKRCDPSGLASEHMDEIQTQKTKKPQGRQSDWRSMKQVEERAVRGMRKLGVMPGNAEHTKEGVGSGETTQPAYARE